MRKNTVQILARDESKGPQKTATFKTSKTTPFLRCEHKILHDFLHDLILQHKINVIAIIITSEKKRHLELTVPIH